MININASHLKKKKRKTRSGRLQGKYSKNIYKLRESSLKKNIPFWEQEGSYKNLTKEDDKN